MFIGEEAEEKKYKWEAALKELSKNQDEQNDNWFARNACSVPKQSQIAWSPATFAKRMNNGGDLIFLVKRLSAYDMRPENY